MTLEGLKDFKILGSNACVSVKIEVEVSSKLYEGVRIMGGLWLPVEKWRFVYCCQRGDSPNNVIQF